MSSFHDEVFLEIDSARKLVAEFKRRPHGSGQAPDAPDDVLLKAAHQEESESAAPEMDCPETLAKEEDPTDGPQDAAEILREIDEARAMERAAAEEKLRKATEKQEAASGTDPARRNPPPADAVRHIWFPGIGASHVWYFSTERERCGPVTFKDLRKMAASGVLDPRLDMVWKKGTPEWKQAGLVDGLYERNIILEEAAAKPTPRPAPVKLLRSFALIEKLTSRNLNWPGAGRRVLIPVVLLFPVLWKYLLSFIEPILASQFGMRLMEILHPVLAIVPPVVLAVLVLNRLTNLGMNRWWSLAIMVPLLNCWVAFLCLFCPAGYAYHRKMDKAGLALIAAFALILPFTWQILHKHPVATYSAYVGTGLRTVVQRAEEIARQYL